MSAIFSDVVQRISSGEDVVLAVIFARAGSAPRTAGARMVVHRDGSIAGTIGGGLLEARTQARAAEVFAQRKALVEEFALDGADASQMEMICGGEVGVLVEPVDSADPSQAAFYSALAQAETGRRRTWLLTRLPDEGESSTYRAWVSIQDGKLSVAVETGASRPALDGLNEFLNQPDLAASRYPVLVQAGLSRLLFEPLGAPGTLVLFGGGHVSQKLAPLAATLGFRIVVVDDRPEFASPERFPEAQQFSIPYAFENALSGLEIDTDSYLVIVTRGHLHDKTVLAQALRSQAGYIGMIGSIRKRDAVYDALREEGFTDADFRRVHSPIGLKIGAESPEEIAVSIAAELIAVRAARG